MFTFEEVVEATEHVVEMRGRDYVYNPSDFGGYTYGTVDKPACIVGCVAVHLGLDPSNWDAIVKADLNTNGSSFGEVVKVIDLPFAEESVKFLRSAQRIQDLHSPWGKAIDYAKYTTGLIEGT